MQISLLLLLSLSSVALASPAPGHRHAHSAAPHKRHAAAAGHNAPRALNSTLVSPKRRATSKRCARRASSSSLAPASTSTSAATKTQAPVGVGINPTAAAPTSSASSSSSEKPESTPTKSTPPSNGNGAVGAPFKPENWPTKTQAAATYAATRATTADPLLLGVSEALNNANNEFFTQTHKGDLTYYGQGLVACGDTYDDSTYTAAVSHLMYDAWPGTTAETNRSPICGPYVPGRQTINAVTGLFQSAAKSSVGSIMIGGDGLPNCDPAAGKQCHIPLTATVTNPANGKSVIVKIVDRCEGCALHDIDMTPTAYKAIADPDLGRVPGIEWHFNKF